MIIIAENGAEGGIIIIIFFHTAEKRSTNVPPLLSAVTCGQSGKKRLKNPGPRRIAPTFFPEKGEKWANRSTKTMEAKQKQARPPPPPTKWKGRKINL